jgi:hypothetical protein
VREGEGGKGGRGSGDGVGLQRAGERWHKHSNRMFSVSLHTGVAAYYAAAAATPTRQGKAGTILLL